MAKMISLNGLPQDLYSAFQANVQPMDVIVGAVVQKAVGPAVNKKLDELLYSKVTMLAEYPTVKKFLSAFAVAAGLYVAQKGSARARGHVVGVLGVEVIDAVGAKVAEMLPAQLKGLVEFNGYGLLTNDAAYGVLTSDSAYGEPNAYSMARFQAASEYMTEGEPEVEYA